MNYTISYIAYKESGKSYNSEVHKVGKYLKYPAEEIYDMKKELELDLDSACGLNKGTVENNNYTVVCVVTDTSISPICATSIVRMKK